MLSTNQALKQWDSVLKLLAGIKAHVAAHPGQNLPENLLRHMHGSFEALSQDLALPAATWKQLLKKKVGARFGSERLHSPALRVYCSLRVPVVTRHPFFPVHCCKSIPMHRQKG
jgi:hypothetical protein